MKTGPPENIQTRKSSCRLYSWRLPISGRSPGVVLDSPGFRSGRDPGETVHNSLCTNDMDYSFIIAPSSSRSKYCVQFACYCYILTTRIAPGLYKARRALYKRAYRAYRIRASDRFGQKITYGIRAG